MHRSESKATYNYSEINIYIYVHTLKSNNIDILRE